MKKIVSSILILVIFLIVVFLLLFNRETSLGEEGFGDTIDISNVNEIEIIKVRGSDEKKIILKDEQAEELFNKFITAKLKEGNNVDEELTESFWITIREKGTSVLGIRMDSTFTLSPYDFNGNKKNSKNYLLEDDTILKNIELLFE